jgi:hypothetical protein
MGIAAERPIPGDQPPAMVPDRGDDHLIRRIAVKGLGQVAPVQTYHLPGLLNPWNPWRFCF